METVLDVRDLHVRFAQEGGTVHAVRGVSFTVGRGETVALVGESGSGKSVTALSVVKLLGDTARVESMYTRLDRYESGPEFRSFGRYRDTFARCKDGRWRFMERNADQEARRAPSASGAGR